MTTEHQLLVDGIQTYELPKDLTANQAGHILDPMAKLLAVAVANNARANARRAVVELQRRDEAEHRQHYDDLLTQVDQLNLADNHNDNDIARVVELMAQVLTHKHTHTHTHTHTQPQHATAHTHTHTH